MQGLPADAFGNSGGAGIGADGPVFGFGWAGKAAAARLLCPCAVPALVGGETSCRADGVFNGFGNGVVGGSEGCRARVCRIIPGCGYCRTVCRGNTLHGAGDIFTNLAAVAGELLGLFNSAVGKAAVLHAFCLLSIALVVGIPGAGLARVVRYIAVVVGAGAVAVFGALYTPANSRVADPVRAIAVSGAGGTDTLQPERGNCSKLTRAAAIAAVGGGVGACLVGKRVA